MEENGSMEPMQSESGTLGLVTDERTGRKTVQEVPQGTTPEVKKVKQEESALLSAEPQVVETPQAEQVAETAEPSPFDTLTPKQEEPQAYTPAEMSLAMQLGQVDEGRIPAEFMPQYMALKAKNEPAPKTAEEVRQEFLDKVSASVKGQTMQEIGITEDELALGEYAEDPEVREKIERYKLALEMNRRKAVDAVYDGIRAEQETQKADQQFRNGVADWINAQRIQEPHFDDIGSYMTEAYKNMRYEDAKAIAPAMEAALGGKLTPEYAAVIQKYYEGCRKEYYAKLNGTSTTPTPRTPVVETKGGGRNVSEETDYGKLLREASPRDKSRIVDAWLNSMR